MREGECSNLYCLFYFFLFSFSFVYFYCYLFDETEILFGEKHKLEGWTRPYFRTLKKGMLVVDHFDLYLLRFYFILFHFILFYFILYLFTFTFIFCVLFNLRTHRYVPKTMCNFSAAFCEKLNSIEGRCVCCVRKKRHEKVPPLPPKPLTKLVHLI